MRVVISELPITFMFAATFYFGLLIFLISNHARIKARNIFILDQSNKKENFKCLDAFRGAAALWVALFHVCQWNGLSKSQMAEFPLILYGVSAVPLFCLISGFLMYNSLHAKNPSLKSLLIYFKGRFLRIYPLYFATLVALLFLGYYNAFEIIGINRPSFLKDALMLRTVDLSFNPLNPTSWSLYVELKFYFLLPLLWFVPRARQEFSICLAGLLFCTIYEISNREELIFKYFFAGILCALLQRFFCKIPTFITLLIFVFGVLYANEALQRAMFFDNFFIKRYSALASISNTKDVRELGIFDLAVGYSFLILGAINTPWIANLLSKFPFRFLGSISYSIFLWHSFLIIQDSRVKTFYNSIEMAPNFQVNGYLLLFIFLPALIAMGAISYTLIEYPFLKLKSKLT